MCTLIAAVGQVEGFPLVVAANRDEALDRPSSGHRLWTEGPVPLIAPKDEVAGGTWLGLNAHGLFVAITNRFMGPRDGARASRGRLVIDALAHPDAAAVHAALASFNAASVNAFHLLYADAQGRAGVTWSDGEKLHQQRLEPGLHIVTERSYGAAHVARAGVIRARWPSAVAGSAPDPAALFELLAHHEQEDPFAALCIHAEALNYGTRSSTVLLLADDPARSRLHTREGPPCQGLFDDRTALLRTLRGGGWRG